MTNSTSLTNAITRRKLMTGAAGAGAALALNFPAPGILAQTRAAIRLGFLNAFTGGNAYVGVNSFNAMSLYFDSINWTIAGRKIQVIKEDDQFNPQIGLEKAKKLIESDKVDILAGVQASNVALAVLNFAKQKKAFYIVTGAGTDAITWDRYPYLFRTSLSTWQLSEPMSDWVYTKIAKEAVTCASDYAGGRDVIAEFKGPFTHKGGKVLKEIYPPLGTTDFSPYLTDIKSINPPVTYNFMPGADAIRYIQQYDQFGLKKTATFTGFALIDSLALKTLGRAALDVITTTVYTDTIDTPENKKFVPAYRAKFNAYPDYFSDYGYVAARCIDEALKATDGDASNKDKLAAAMVKVSFNAPRGPFRFDPVTHNPIQDVYVCKAAELAGGRIGNQVLGKVENVRDPGSKPH
jgi:branched-chain amino acid transport system substrate-binding protein